MATHRDEDGHVLGTYLFFGNKAMPTPRWLDDCGPGLRLRFWGWARSRGVIQLRLPDPGEAVAR